jgi:2-desacetyl-2-hydroxyethyl bacteriochlorophyllide A dehydrogenase
LAVEVVDTGKNVTGLKKGDRGCIEPYRNPTIGQAVRRGRTNCGENLTVFGVHEDGGMQEYIVFSADHVHGFNDLSFDQLALIEPLAIGKHAVDRAEILPEDIVLVVGAGPIGLCTVEFAKLTGARVIVMDVNQSRLDFCQKHLGIDDLLLAAQERSEQLRSYLNGDLPTVILDATGNPGSMQDTFHYAAAGSTIVFIGLFLGDVSFYDPLFHKKEITLKASRSALPKDFREIGQFMEKGTIDPTWMITHRFTLNEVAAHFGELLDPGMGVIKAVIDL